MFRIKQFMVFTTIMVVALMFLATMPLKASGVADMEGPYWVITQDSFGSGYIQMSEDGNILASVDNQLKLSVYDLDAKENLWDFVPANGLSTYNSFVLSADGSTLVAVDDQGTLFYMDVSKGNEPLWTYNATDYVDMAINNNGTLLYVVTIGNIITLGEKGFIETYGSDSFIKGGAQVAMAIDTGRAIVYDDFHAWSKYSPTDEWFASGTSVTIEKVLMAEDGSSTTYVYGDGKVSVSKTTSSGGKNWALDLPFDVLSTNIQMSLDGSTILVQRENGDDVTLFAIDVASEKIIWQKTFSGSGYFKLSGDGHLIMYSYYWSKTTRAIDKWTGDPLVESGFEYGDICLVSYDGSTVVLTDLVTMNVFKEPVMLEDGQDDNSQLQMLVMIGLAIGIVNLVLLVVLLIRKK